jgi:hypothetical protein
MLPKKSFQASGRKVMLTASTFSKLLALVPEDFALEIHETPVSLVVTSGQDGMAVSAPEL